MIKGVLQFILSKENVIFYPTTGDKIEFDTLDDFLDYNFGCEGATIYTSTQELNVIYDYLQNLKDKYDSKLIYVSNFIEKIIGLKMTKKGSKRRFKTFYDLKFKLGSDELKIKDSLNLIENTEFKTYNQGFTSKLRKEIVTEEKLCRATIKYTPSMAPNIYTKTMKEFYDVECWDITSAYPYLLTQPLPHYEKWVDFESEEQFNEKDVTYYGAIEIFNLSANNCYYPLTLVGKNNKKIDIEDQGKNIFHQGVRIISADSVILCGFIPHLLTLLKNNYSFSSYRISRRLIKFKLEIDWELRKTVIKYFEKKQEKKRNNLDYSGEKILLNRLYGFFITKGSNSAAHYGQYIVSKERLIIDDLIQKIGLENVVHCHTDSIKFTGNFSHIIKQYNDTIDFPELGRFVLEDKFQKCVYYSHITGKYIDRNGKLNFKHGGIDKIGIAHLYKKNYEEITEKTKFFLVRSYFYLKGEGYYPNYIITNFSQSVDYKEE